MSISINHGQNDKSFDLDSDGVLNQGFTEINISTKGDANAKHHVDPSLLNNEANAITEIFELIRSIYIDNGSLNQTINIQPTTYGRTITRWTFSHSSLPIQASLRFTPLSNGYSKENFDAVAIILKEKTKEIDQIFQDTLTLVERHVINQLNNEDLARLKQHIEPVRKAFKVFVTSRLGLHRWARNIHGWSDEHAAHKISEIANIINSQNKVIADTYLKALSLNPVQKELFLEIEQNKAKASAESVTPVSSATSVTGTTNINVEISRLINSTKELLDVITKTATQLSSYKTELDSLKEDVVLLERLQISAYETLLNSACLMHQKYHPIAENLGKNPSTEQLLHVIDELYHSFISTEDKTTESGNTFLSLLISATTDINDASRGNLNSLVESAEIKGKLTYSRQALWQTIAFQKISGRFQMPLAEMKKAVIALQLGVKAEEKINTLIHHFKVVGTIANRTSQDFRN